VAQRLVCGAVGRGEGGGAARPVPAALGLACGGLIVKTVLMAVPEGQGPCRYVCRGGTGSPAWEALPVHLARFKSSVAR
jgi:hypothetical protein